MRCLLCFAMLIVHLGLPVVPVLALPFFHDKMDGVNVVAMLLAISLTSIRTILMITSPRGTSQQEQKLIKTCFLHLKVETS